MKKLILAAIFALCFVSVDAYAQVYVSSADGLQYLFNNGYRGDVVLSSDIISNSGLSVSNPRVNMFIIGDKLLSMSGGNSAQKGGCINVLRGEINFNVMEILFAWNTAVNGGGAINNTGVLNFTSSSVNFIGNKVSGAKGSGGAILNWSAKITFTSSGVKFTSNTAVNGGAIDDEGTTAFVSSAVNFTSNTASGLGGAIFTSGNLGFMSSVVNFTGNAAGSDGGAIYNDYSALNFTASTVNFTGNSAENNGAAIFNYKNIMFTSSLINFTSNTAGSDGGAVYNNYGAIGFTASTVNFTGNNASRLGGAIYNADGNIIFTYSAVKFTDNKALNACALYNHSGAINFIDSTVSFTDNKAVYNGAAIFNLKNIKFMSSAVNFTSNTAVNGGAIYNVSGGIINFAASTVNFISNTSEDSGGAIYAFDSELNFSGGEIRFINNESKTGIGGAIYVKNSVLTFNSDGGGISFTGNKANGELNDIYMDSGSKVNINGSNNITFNGGIITDASGAGIEINKNGSGKMYIGGKSEIWGDFNISGSGDIVMIGSATYSGKALQLGGTSGLDMHNEEGGRAVNKIKVDGDFRSESNLKMDIFAQDTGNGRNDEIIANTAHIGGNIDIYAKLGAYDNEEYDLIITTGIGSALSGVFVSRSIDDTNLKYEIKYDNGIVKLIVNGKSATEFEKLSPLTYNQKETAKAFDSISEEIGQYGQWNAILTDMRNKQSSGKDEEVKEFLSETSGYFLANVIRNAAADSPNNEVYDKVRNHIEEAKTNSGIWVQVKGGQERFKEDENSIKDYSDISMGVMFGFDRYVTEVLNGDIMWGVYGRINKDNIEQGRSKADGNKNGIGVYGGYLKEKWEIKGMLLGSYDKFSTERSVKFSNVEEIAKADISALTINGDIEGAVKIKISDSIELKPYAGIEAQEVNYGSFKEKGAGQYNLEVESGNYFRSAARLGAGIDYERGRWIWYANAEGKYLISGNKPEIESVFEGTKEGFKSRGSEEGEIALGVGAGGEVRVANNWKIFANAKYYAAQRYDNIAANAGVRYCFGRYASINDNDTLEKTKEEERKVEESKIKEEMSDTELEKEKEKAQERRKKPVIKSFNMELNFKSNEYFLTEESKESLMKVAQEIAKYEYKQVTIEGHTDSTGSKETNKRLSRQRARTVYEEFIKNGMNPEKMTYIGYADTMPVQSNKTKSGRAANRRTEIYVE